MKKRLTMILAFMFLSLGVAMAQTKVAGTVLSQEDNEPIIGAVVKLKGQKQALAVTDIEGNFSFTTSQKNATLEVSSVGYVTVTVKAGPKLMIHMTPDSRSIDEVVVTGMQKMDKRLFTGSATKVDAEKAKLDGVADISRSLEGRAAGVSVQNVSGTFGTAPKSVCVVQRLSMVRRSLFGSSMVLSWKMSQRWMPTPFRRVTLLR